MARRTTLVVPSELESALRAASRAEGVSQSELIRRGISAVTARYRRRRRPPVGWLKVSRAERKAVLSGSFGDPDV